MQTVTEVANELIEAERRFLRNECNALTAAVQAGDDVARAKAQRLVARRRALIHGIRLLARELSICKQ